MTGGRTRPAHTELEIEALVSTTSLWERRLDLPLGVTRVLVGDMADEGMVMVHRPTQGADRPDLALLERVLYGLRSI
jgi:hypothetical protein